MAKAKAGSKAAGSESAVDDQRLAFWLAADRMLQAADEFRAEKERLARMIRNERREVSR